MRGITNARPKDGVQTINNIAPDALGGFTIEAGQNVTITPGTNKITIDVAGGGGEWTLRTANNDWRDLFSVVGSNMVSLKDIFIQPISGMYTNTVFRYLTFAPVFIPKGTLLKDGNLYIPATIRQDNGLTAGIYASNLILLTKSILGSNDSTLYVYSYRVTINVGSDFTVTYTPEFVSDTIDKNKFHIMTRE